MKCTPALLLLAFIPVLPVCAQAPLTVDQLVAMARERNTSLEWDRRSARDAREALRLSPLVTYSSVGASAYLGTGSGSLGERLSASTYISVPILPQLSASARLWASGSVSGSTSLTVSPFAPPRLQPWTASNARMSELRLSAAESVLRDEVEEAAHRVLATEAVWLAEQRIASLFEVRYTAAHERFLLDAISFLDLEAERGLLEQAQARAATAESERPWARDALKWILGSPEQEIKVAEVPMGDLMGRISALELELAAITGAPESLDLEMARSDLELARESLKRASFRPDLSVSLAVEYDTGGVDASGSLSVSFSPDDLRSRERQGLAQSVADATRDLEDAVRDARHTADSLEEEVRIRRRALELADLQASRAQAVLDRVRSVTEAGQDTADVEMAQAVLDAAKARQFAAAAKVVAQLVRLLRHHTGG